MNKKLNFGIIGCSSISERSTIPAIQKSDFAEIEIIGTFVIPEFGTIVTMIFVIGIISMIAISAKTKLNLLPKA